MNEKVAIITGGSGGIGIACAHGLKKRGYDVLLTARREGPLRAAAEECGARWMVADASDDTAFKAVVDSVERVDLLVHSAGLNAGTFVRKETLATFEEVLRANLTSAFIVTAAALPKMRPGGRIIFMSSSSSKAPMKGLSAYSASKAGLNAYAEALAAELARDGIHVNTVIPAPVDTAMLERVTFAMHALQSSDVADAVVFLDGLDPRVVIPEIFLRAATEGPLAPEAVIPTGAVKR